VLAARQRYDEAAREYDQALALDAALPHVPLHYALLEADQGRFDQVRRRLEQALEQQPQSPIYHTFCGWLLAEAGDLDAAWPVLDRALALAPDNKLTLNGEAYLLFRQGFPAEAVARLRRDGLCSNHAMQARLLLGIEKAVAAGHLQPPGQASQPPPSLQPLPASARRCLRLGVKRLEQGRCADAVALLERAQELDANLPEVGFYLGAAYFEAGRYEDARRMLEADHKRHPEPDPKEGPPTDPYWLYLAATYLRLGHLNAAEPCLKHAPDGSDADFYRGLAALLQGQERAAVALFRQVLARDGSLLQRRLADFAGIAMVDG
jgi:tetratricopeptide (TPR) repeat protein